MKEQLRIRAERIDDALHGFLEPKDNPQKSIYDAMNYSVFAGGKRLRPILMTEVCQMCGGEYDEVVPFACAVEMIHTYSLIHDDLPAMDNDDLRRGMPTSHIKFGEAQAILAGDALLNKAFETACGYSGKYPERALAALKIMAASSGTEGMIGGQVLDIEGENRDISVSEMEYIHLLKTGALIRSSCVVGAVMAGAEDSEIKAIDEFAKNLGIAFQICDDILDVTGTDEELGKKTGSDEKSDKNTYVKLAGLEKSQQLVREYSEKAVKALEVFGSKADFLVKLTYYMAGRTS